MRVRSRPEVIVTREEPPASAEWPRSHGSKSPVSGWKNTGWGESVSERDRNDVPTKMNLHFASVRGERPSGGLTLRRLRVPALLGAIVATSACSGNPDRPPLMTDPAGAGASTSDDGKGAGSGGG